MIAPASRVAMAICDSDHFCGTFYRSIGTMDHGDSLHRAPPENVLCVFQWLLSGTHYLLPNTLGVGKTGSQTLGGPGSCGVIVHNYVECQVDQTASQWQADRSQHYRDTALRDLIMYNHCAAESGLVSHELYGIL